jgi:hypothetical protein
MREQATVIRWEDPKPSLQRRERSAPWSRYRAVAAELRTQPGRWAVIDEFPGRNRTTLATHIRRGAIDCFTPAGDFDAVARQVFGHTAIYARYVGDEDAL